MNYQLNNYNLHLDFKNINYICNYIPAFKLNSNNLDIYKGSFDENKNIRVFSKTK